MDAPACSATSVSVRRVAAGARKLSGDTIGSASAALRIAVTAPESMASSCSLITLSGR